MTLPPLTPEENVAANLGARMAAEGFNVDDNPYPATDPKHAQWWRAWQWCHRLVGSAARVMITSSNQVNNAKRRTCAHQWATIPSSGRMNGIPVAVTCVHCHESRKWTLHPKG